MSHIFSILFQFIPENIALVLLAIIFLNKPPKFKIVTICGIIGGITLYLIRLIPLTFGIHTLVFILILSLSLSYIYKEKLLKTTFVSLKVFIILAIYEIIFTTIFLNYTSLNINLSILNNNLFLKTLIILPQTLMMYITALLLYKYKMRNVNDV